MITRLYIENYLLIDTLDIDFQEGLNIVTGETGAGKSILLGAISLLLGGKNDKTLISKSGGNTIIEGTFEIEKYGVEPLFIELDLEYDHSTIIRRVIMPSGKSRTYINDLPVPLATLQRVGENLMDIHSQHQTMLLSHEDFQTNIVDSVAGNKTLLSQYKVQFTELKRLKLRLSKLHDDLSNALKDQDFIKFQYNELFEANLTSGEIEELELSQKLLSNGSQIRELLSKTTNILSQEDNAIISQIKQLATSFSKVEDILPNGREISERLSSLLYELKDIDSEVSSQLDHIDIDPTRLEEVTNRIDRLYTLMTKHRVKSVDSLIEIREDLETKLQNIDLGSYHIEQCEKQIAQCSEKGHELAAELSRKRGEVSVKIEKYVTTQLKSLGIESCIFEVNISASDELTIFGSDKIEFRFSANKGILPQPISKVASGGEMSRLMLSLKSLMAAHRNLPTIIFDEIDTGVSGRVADKMGEIMEHLGQNMQIICITHLPQVAAKGGSHFLVSKGERNGATVTEISPLTDEQRINQIATMISGNKISDAAYNQAKLLLSRENL